MAQAARLFGRRARVTVAVGVLAGISLAVGLFIEGPRRGQAAGPVGDLNGDAAVSILDLSILLSHYGSASAIADINRDGTVNVLDLSALLVNYGKSVAIGSGAALVMQNCSPVWLGTDSMVFNRRQVSGHWDVLTGDRSCGGAQPLLAPHQGHRGASDVSADGRWVLLETDFGTPRGQDYAEPGKGFANDLELYDRQTGRLTRLTSGRKGTIWARFNAAANKVAWTELVKTQFEADTWNNLLGVWSLHVADITPAGQLANERSWQHPSQPGFIESYGWLGDKVMFASDSGVNATNPWMGHWYASQLWLIDDSLAAGALPTRVSPPFEGANEYHEFMTLADPGAFSDEGPWILTSIVRDTQPFNGMDMWRMRPDGTGRQRLTYFNGNQNQAVNGYPSPKYHVVGGVVTDPTDSSRVLAGVTPDPNAKVIDAWWIKLR